MMHIQRCENTTHRQRDCKPGATDGQNAFPASRLLGKLNGILVEMLPLGGILW
jgi:hypothetical protein